MSNYMLKLKIKHNIIRVITLLVVIFMMNNLPSFCSNTPQMKGHPNYIIILVHGIGGENENYTADDYRGDKGGFKGYLEDILYLKDYVYAYDYSDNLQSNIDNAHELGDPNTSEYWIGRAFNEYAHKKGYSSISEVPETQRPQKVILIAHSMGGLSTRYYLTSNYYRNDVKKLITLDSPRIGARG
jgi:triacylglycerol esterase/lipase EstA (alpha/beta hydrolase family)